MLYEGKAGRGLEVGLVLLCSRVRRVIGRDDVDAPIVQCRQECLAIARGLDRRVALDARAELGIA